MNLTLIQFGKTKDRWLQEGINEYLKRLGPYHKISILELPDASLKANQDEEAVRSKEAASAMRHIQPQDSLILLDEAGELNICLLFSQFLSNLSSS